MAEERAMQDQVRAYINTVVYTGNTVVGYIEREERVSKVAHHQRAKTSKLCLDNVRAASTSIAKSTLPHCRPSLGAGVEVDCDIGY
jgi:hypothetical protein